MTYNDAIYYGNLIIKLTIFQVIFSILKIIIIGIRENIVGTISDLGGGIGVHLAIMCTILLWYMHGRELKGKDWFYSLSFLIIPLASNKRAIWFMYPFILIFILFDKISHSNIKRTFYIILLIPIVLFFGFRLNPTLNPENTIWGSFDLNYGINYALSYSGVSEEKLMSPYAQGRWGASSAIVKITFQNPFSRESLLGFGRSRSGNINTDLFDPKDYGLMPGTMISGIGIMFIQMGWPATILIILLFILMIYNISDKRIRNFFIIYILWDIILYSGSLITTIFHSILLIIFIYIFPKYYQSLYNQKGL